MGEFPSVFLIWTVGLEKSKKSPIKLCVEKSTLLDFVNLSAMFFQDCRSVLKVVIL